MGKRILVAVLLVVLISLAIMGFIFARTAEKSMLEQLEESMINHAWLIQHLVVKEIETIGIKEGFEPLAAYLSKEIGARVTIIDKTGKVLGDSDADAAQLESHFQRPEVQEALMGGKGKSIRYSTSLRMKMLYLAVPILYQEKVEGVVRLALPLKQLQLFTQSLWKRMLIAGLVSLLAAVVVSYLVTRILTKPLREAAIVAKEIAQGQYSRRMSSQEAPGEIKALASAFNEMAGNLETVIEELTERKNRLEAILGSMDDGLIAVDYGGKVIMLNSPAEKLFKVTGEQGLHRHLLEVTRNEGLYNVVNEVLQAKKAVHQELSWHTTEERNLLVHAAPLQGEAGWGAVAIIRDITSLKKTEQMRSEFVANVSHELKTPLTSIKGYVETLLDGAYLNSEVNLRFLEIIHKETERLNRLIEDLLHLSWIENSKGQLNRLPVKLPKVVQRVVNVLTPSIEEKRQTVEVDFPHDLPLVWASEDSLERIILNLVDNASKYSPPSSLITITMEEEGEMLAFYVTDQGAGIPSESLPRLFERFYRLDKARTRENEGTGLGLALVKHLVDGLEGTIEVTSEIGKGSRFKVKLPKAR